MRFIHKYKARISLKVDDGGIDVIGDISYTGSIGPRSDKRLKQDIREINTKKAVELVKYIVPKTYKFIDKEYTVIGRIVVLLLMIF